MGVASPSAQGQAMMSTATALMSAWASRGSGPTKAQTTNVMMAVRMTRGTKYEATTSASFWMGARLRCASATMATMRDSSVSAPTFSARTTSAPVPLTVAPITASPLALDTGMGSPVTIASSTALCPSSTTPSTGIFSPGRTRSRSPTWTWSSGTSSSLPSSLRRRAVVGASPSRDLIAAPVRLRAFSSSTCPSRINVTITPDASK